MQQVCLQLGKLIIQSVVNTQGVAVMAAFTAVNRVDDFAYTPQQNIGHAMTTFLAQNKGAGHKERMKKGFQTGLLIELVYSIGLFCVIWGLAPQIMTLFAEDGDAQVVSLGISYLHLISWMYILPGLTNGVQGFFRGIGDLKVTLYSTFMNMFGRVVAVFVMIRLLQMEFASLAWACPFLLLKHITAGVIPPLWLTISSAVLLSVPHNRACQAERTYSSCSSQHLAG